MLPGHLSDELLIACRTDLSHFEAKVAFYQSFGESLSSTQLDGWGIKLLAVNESWELGISRLLLIHNSRFRKGISISGIVRGRRQKTRSRHQATSTKRFGDDISTGGIKRRYST